MKKQIARATRPTEKVTGVALAAAVYGFMAQSGAPNLLALGVAVVVAFGPTLVSRTVAGLRLNSTGTDLRSDRKVVEAVQEEQGLRR